MSALQCLEAGLAEVTPGKLLGDVGTANRELDESHGYGVVRELGGRGVGRKLHEQPRVEHFVHRGHGLRLREGMAYTVEPMINEGTPEIRFLEHGWTVVTAEGKLSAQYEHTITVTSSGCKILTPWHHYMCESTGVA
jgi:methionyl aminopeptidase